MKGIIEAKTEKSWTKPGESVATKFFEVTVNGKQYSNWQHDKMSPLKIGEEIEFDEAEKNGKWKLTLGGGAKGGFQPRGKSPEEVKLQGHSFAASYAKDVVVACIAQGIVTDSKGIDAAILHWNNLFKGILEG
jgi:hypothetical protein